MHVMETGVRIYMVRLKNLIFLDQDCCKYYIPSTDISLYVLIHGTWCQHS
jgi:hypothetical protein